MHVPFNVVSAFNALAGHLQLQRGLQIEGSVWKTGDAGDLDLAIVIGRYA